MERNERKEQIKAIFHDVIENYVFCYAGKEGQGLVPKKECECLPKRQRGCAAYHEQCYFYDLFEEFEKQGLTRSEILKCIETKIPRDGSHWLQYNVKKYD